MGKLQLNLPHIEAARQIATSNFTYGDVLTYDFLYQAFGIDKPNITTPLERAHKSQWQFLSCIKKLEEFLLEVKLMAIMNIRGEGYQIVHPSEQTRWAEHEGMTEISKAFSKMHKRQINVNHSLLTSEQRKENVDALSRATMLESMLNRINRKVLFDQATIEGDYLKIFSQESRQPNSEML